MAWNCTGKLKQQGSIKALESFFFFNGAILNKASLPNNEGQKGRNSGY